MGEALINACRNGQDVALRIDLEDVRFVKAKEDLDLNRRRRASRYLCDVASLLFEPLRRRSVATVIGIVTLLAHGSGAFCVHGVLGASNVRLRLVEKLFGRLRHGCLWLTFIPLLPVPQPA